MAKKESLVFNGYRIPGGRGGAAVIRACQLIRQQPGIKQTDLINHVTQWAGLNLSTAGWITSPGDKSPAERLWDRRKEGRGFKCYPNEHTPDLDPRVFLRDVVSKEFDKAWAETGRVLPGELVHVAQYGGGHEVGMLLGFDIYRHRMSAEGTLTSREEIDSLTLYDKGNFSLNPAVRVPKGRMTAVMGWLSRAPV